MTPSATQSPPRPERGKATLYSRGEMRRFDSQSLFANSSAILIRHGDADYLLRITSQNKLILTK